MNTLRKKPGLMRRVLTSFVGAFRLSNDQEKLPDLVEDLEQAWLEWKQARLYFNNVIDPDLIDYAIFYMGATEKKYIYLLKKARATGVNIDGFEYGLSRH
jgi:hypothetical protein